MRVLVTEKIADGGLQRLRDGRPRGRRPRGAVPRRAGGAVVGAHALIIRSATQVTAEVLAAG